ncbi:hypothetical protein [Streptomyces xantholiticus]|uniref:hypothetical protein n=1 Tax=Streptomyces xantholiticus TaxID=68285 RepID=UPI0016741384|nr:hypothetical protein [Streptomyces xantholiticus]GGW75491.1 hypothetical protein GCM10010381_70000 [Streptomyces xantholiticus]
MKKGLPVQNAGENLVSLFIEPYGEDFWLQPGEVFTVTPTVAGVDVQFSMAVAADHITVWLYEDADPYKVILDFEVLDEGGAALECGHQRPTASREERQVRALPSTE